MDDQIVKKCFKCNEIKPIAFFYRHPQNADGYLNKCKECAKADSRKNYAENHDYYVSYDRKRNSSRKEYNAGASKKRKKRNRESIRASQAKWSAKNKIKRKAHLITRRAILSGKIERKACLICGCTEAETHHHDYNRALDVVWLCDKHHKLIHVLMRRKSELSVNPSLILKETKLLTVKEKFVFLKEKAKSLEVR